MKIVQLTSGKRILIFSRFKSKHFVSTNDKGDVRQAMAREHSRLHDHLLEYFGHNRIFFIRAQNGHLVEVADYREDDESRQIFGDGAMYLYFKSEARLRNPTRKVFRPPIIGCTTGDCPFVMFEADKNYCRTIGLVHSGWRGCVANIVGQAVRKARELDFAPDKLTVGLWSGICGNCYEVDRPVRDALFAYPHAFRHGRDAAHWQLSLASVVRQQLREAGVAESQIVESRLCPKCYRDERGEHLFYSHRRLIDGRNDVRRNGLFIMA